LVVLAVLLAWGLMWLGWKRRQARQSDVAAPPAAPADLVGRAVAEGAEGTYVSTTAADQPLERVTAHGLGATGVAHLLVADDAGGLVFARDGAPDVFVPVSALTDVRVESMRAGKAAPRGLLVVEWRLGDRQVATAFRPRDPHDREALLQTLRSLISRQDAA
jgi:hypothetical protein